MLSDERAMTRLGVVTGTHGLRGDLKVRPLSPDAPALLGVKHVYLRRESAAALSCQVKKVSEHKSGFVVRLEGYDNIDAVAPLVGSDILVSVAEMPPIEDGSHYWAEIEGMSVVDRRLGEIGTMSDVFATAAHEVYVVDGRYGEVLIPAVPAFILNVDVVSRRVEVDLPEGLVTELDDL